MIIHVTRHGQILTEDGGQAVNGVDYPYGENPLTELGREQATRLGQRLRDMGFKGKIYASPYRRAMNTAACVARQTGSPIIPVPLIREVVSNSKWMIRFEGMTTEEYYREYGDFAIEGVTLEAPWWTQVAESLDDVTKRVGIFIEKLLVLGEDCLLVGHGASVKGATQYLFQKYGFAGRNLGNEWNSCLTTFEIAHGACRPLRINDVGHLPADQVTDNYTFMVSRQG